MFVLLYLLNKIFFTLYLYSRDFLKITKFRFLNFIKRARLVVYSSKKQFFSSLSKKNRIIKINEKKLPFQRKKKNRR